MNFEKVNFMLIGAPKSATTTVAKILENHPEIGFSSIKEPNFFSKDKDWKNNIDKYHNLFLSNTAKIYGEASTTYTFYPKWNLNIWNDIYKYNSEMKFIYIIRNPIDRTLSQYTHWLERGYTNKEFNKAIIETPEIIETSKYFMQISPYINKFGTNKVLILKFEDFIDNKDLFLNKIASFLKVDFKLFENYQDMYLNKSLKEAKIHHSFDQMKTKLDWIKRIFPKKIIKPIWNLITSSKSSNLKYKPQFNKDDKNLILNILNNDLINLKGIINFNIDDYFNID